MIEFKRYTNPPDVLDETTLNDAVSDFVKKSDAYKTPLNKAGFQKSLWDIMGSVLVLKNTQTDFIWFALDEAGKVKAFAITGVSRDIDNELTYWGRCAWVHPEYRGKPVVKEWFNQLRSHAKQLLCKHFVVISSRNNKAYLRFLGKNYHPYAVLLKEDL